MKQLNLRESVSHNWHDILEYQEQLKYNFDKKVLDKYVDLVTNDYHKTPTHIRPITDAISHLENVISYKNEEIIILDHGCGGGSTLLYLAALGYCNLYGVDVGGETKELNLALQRLTGKRDQHIFVYDGANLPFANNSIDLIFSQQVLEHVDDEMVDRYIRDEARVLKPYGLIYHQIPHRLTPWESHTKLWFVHYLPKKLRCVGYKQTGKDPEYIERVLHLRAPKFYYKKFLTFFDNLNNCSAKRIVLEPDYDLYEGCKPLRKAIGCLIKIPLMDRLLSKFMMLDLKCSKPKK